MDMHVRRCPQQQAQQQTANRTKKDTEAVIMPPHKTGAALIRRLHPDELLSLSYQRSLAISIPLHLPFPHTKGE
jgi:hypothetical protein